MFIILPLAIDVMSGQSAVYGLIACELSHAGSVVEPGDITLLLNCFESISDTALLPLLLFSDCKGARGEEPINAQSV